MRTKHFRLCRITTSLGRHELRKVATTLTLGALAVALAISTGAPAFAGKPHQSRPGGHHEQTQEHKMSAAKKGKTNNNKKKSVKKTFSNAESVAIPAEGAVDKLGPASIYPSAITVSGFKQAKIIDLNLTLRDFSHEFMGDVQLLLLAPGGRNAVVMGDVAETVDASSNLTFTLDDEAAISLPEDEPLTSGTFRPLDGHGLGITGFLTEFPAPAPPPSGTNALATFDGLNPNGEWRLFILDDNSSDVGSLADGWALEITAKSKVKNKGNGKKKR